MDQSRSDRTVGVVVPAAGQGTRLGGRRKQFRMLGDAPVLVHTVRRFSSHPLVASVVIPTDADLVSDVERQLIDAGLRENCRIVSGGDTRQASVAAGLAALPPDAALVLVHDAVRPFVSAEVIEAVVAAVRDCGAAAAAIPVSDTLRRARNGSFGETVDRRDLYRMQTPQGFRRDWLEEALRRAAEDGIVETDDVALLQRQDRPVKMVRGHVHNFKITTPADWERAQLLWKMTRGANKE